MRVAFRMESSHAIGMGHVMRCLTLAHALRDRGWDVMFLCSRQTSRAVHVRWSAAVCYMIPDGLSQRQDAARCRVVLMKHAVDWLVVDHYGLDAVYEAACARVVHRVLAIDDLARAHAADVVQDSAPYGCKRYHGKLVGWVHGLFGPRYALLRPSIMVARKQSLGMQATRVFVCFGGADPHDTTRRVARLLVGKCNEVDFVVGYAYQGKDTLLALCQRQAGWKLHVNHPAPEMLMAQAKLAIGAGGTMTWERCAVGVASLVISIADNQCRMSESLAALGVIDYLGTAEEVSDAVILQRFLALQSDVDECERLRASGRRLVDGLGVMRVVNMMRRVL